ncbi:unnamed protein product [Camellia sinensis]
MDNHVGDAGDSPGVGRGSPIIAATVLEVQEIPLELVEVAPLLGQQIWIIMLEVQEIPLELVEVPHYWGNRDMDNHVGGAGDSPGIGGGSFIIGATDMDNHVGGAGDSPGIGGGFPIIGATEIWIIMLEVQEIPLELVEVPHYWGNRDMDNHVGGAGDSPGIGGGSPIIGATDMDNHVGGAGDSLGIGGGSPIIGATGDSPGIGGGSPIIGATDMDNHVGGAGNSPGIGGGSPIIGATGPHSVHRAYAGEGERISWKAFAEASSRAKSGKPSVIFIDEIDALCPRRDSRKRARYSCSLSAFYAYGLQQTHIKICATGGCGGIY